MSFIFLKDEYEMILPLHTALPFSHRSIGEVFGKSFISKKEDLKNCESVF